MTTRNLLEKIFNGFQISKVIINIIFILLGGRVELNFFRSHQKYIKSIHLKIHDFRDGMSHEGPCSTLNHTPSKTNAKIWRVIFPSRSVTRQFMVIPLSSQLPVLLPSSFHGQYQSFVWQQLIRICREIKVAWIQKLTQIPGTAGSFNLFWIIPIHYVKITHFIAMG